MAHRNQSQISQILKRLIGKETRKPSRRDSPNAKRSLRAEHLEARRVFAGLVFDSVILAGSDTSTASPLSAAVDGVGNTYMVGVVSGATDFDLDNTHAGDSDIIVPRGYSDGFVAKYDQNNEFLWVRRVGGDSPDSGTDIVYDIGADAAGNVYITGEFNDQADFGPFTIQSQGASDGFTAKLDTNGIFQWVKSWGGIEANSPSGIVVSAQGQVSVTGTAGLNYESTLPQSSGIDIRQFDSLGKELWAHFLPGSTYNRAKISSTAAGELVVSGGFRGDIDLDPDSVNEFLVSGPTDQTSIYVMQLSDTGSFQWGNSLIVDTVANPGSGLIEGGMTIGSDGAVALIADLNGTVDVDANGIGHIVDAGSTQKRLFARYDAAGQFQVATIHSDDPFLYTSGITAFGSGYYATGTTDSSGVFQPAPGISVVGNRYSLFLMEMDQNGTPLSALVIGGTGNELPPQVQTDSNGNLIVIGSSSSSTIDFDPDPINTAIHTNPAFSDGFVLSLRPTMPGESVTLFGDSFEQSEWNGNWVEDSQNDWFRSSQRATSGSFAAEVDGSATNATLTTANVIDLSGMASATLSFDWLIESGFDSGEYLAMDISTNGGLSWTQDVRRLNGNVSVEDVWHSETVDLTPYMSADLKIRFRSKVSASDEDANVDNVRIVGIADGPNTAPIAVVGGPYSVSEGSSVTLSGAGSSDPDGSIASFAWDLDNDGQYDDASGMNANFSTTVSGLHTIGLQVTDNRGATAVTSTTVTVNNVAPTANAGSDVNGFVGTPLSLSANGSSDPGNDIVSYAWDLDDDGQYDDATGVNAQFTAALAGSYQVGVRVTDADGAISTDSALITFIEAPSEVVMFEDSFEVGEWNGLWGEDTQNDWFRSTQRATDGTRSAEVDGSATNATLTIAAPINLTGYAAAQLSFDWLIESGFDTGEYLALDISANGGTTWQNDVRRLNGNVSMEEVWHQETVNLMPYHSSNLKFRFRSTVSDSREDANVDNVKVVASSTVGGAAMASMSTPSIGNPLGTAITNSASESVVIVPEMLTPSTSIAAPSTSSSSIVIQPTPEPMLKASRSNFAEAVDSALLEMEFTQDPFAYLSV